MKKYNKSIGFYGEDLSAKFLEKEGYSIFKKTLIVPLEKLIL